MGRSKNMKEKQNRQQPRNKNVSKSDKRFFVMQKNKNGKKGNE